MNAQRMATAGIDTDITRNPLRSGVQTISIRRLQPEGAWMC